MTLTNDFQVIAFNGVGTLFARKAGKDVTVRINTLFEDTTKTISMKEFRQIPAVKAVNNEEAGESA